MFSPAAAYLIQEEKEHESRADIILKEDITRLDLSGAHRCCCSKMLQKCREIEGVEIDHGQLAIWPWAPRRVWSPRKPSKSTHLHGLCWISSVVFVVPKKGTEAVSLPATSYTDATSWADAANPWRHPLNLVHWKFQLTISVYWSAINVTMRGNYYNYFTSAVKDFLYCSSWSYLTWVVLQMQWQCLAFDVAIENYGGGLLIMLHSQIWWGLREKSSNLLPPFFTQDWNQAFMSI